MTNLRTISIVKKKSPRRDSIDEWVAMTNPLSGEMDPLKVSASALNDSDCEYNPEEGISFEELRQREIDSTKEQPIHFTITGFFRLNNELVDGAVASGYEPGELYDRFLTFGLRVSQQLDGQFRIRTLRQYDKVRAELRQNLLDYTVGVSREKRNQRLDQILECSASVPEQDKEAIGLMVDQLKQQEIRVVEKIGYSTLTINDIVKNTLHDGNNELMEYFPKVSDNLKARFLRIVKYDQLIEKRVGRDSEFPFYEEVFTVLQNMDEEAGGLYLDRLHEFLVGGKQNDFQTWAFESVYSHLQSFNDAERKVYFDTLSITLKAGLRECNPWIALGAAYLLGKYTPDKIRDIVRTSISENRGNELAVTVQLGDMRYK